VLEEQKYENNEPELELFFYYFSLLYGRCLYNLYRRPFYIKTPAKHTLVNESK